MLHHQHQIGVIMMGESTMVGKISPAIQIANTWQLQSFYL